MLVSEGIDAIGLNFVSSSPRSVTIEVARSICNAIGTNVTTVAVVANMPAAAVRLLLAETGIQCVQFHGDEEPALVAQFLPHAYKAIAIRDAKDVEIASAYAGDHLLVDAKVDGQLGGTGQAFDWQLVKHLAQTRKVTLAGGLTSANVGCAISIVRPYCVDVASGVESTPGIKDPAKVRAFVEAAFFTT